MPWSSWHRKWTTKLSTCTAAVFLHHEVQFSLNVESKRWNGIWIGKFILLNNIWYWTYCSVNASVFNLAVQSFYTQPTWNCLIGVLATLVSNYWIAILSAWPSGHYYWSVGVIVDRQASLMLANGLLISSRTCCSDVDSLPPSSVLTSAPRTAALNVSCSLWGAC